MLNCFTIVGSLHKSLSVSYYYFPIIKCKLLQISIQNETIMRTDILRKTTTTRRASKHLLYTFLTNEH